MTCERRWWSEGFVNEKEVWGGMFEDIGNGVGWIMGMNGQEWGRWFEKWEQRGCDVEGWRGENGDGVWGFCGGGNECWGECIGGVVELLIGGGCGGEGWGFLMR